MEQRFQRDWSLPRKAGCVTQAWIARRIFCHGKRRRMCSGFRLGSFSAVSGTLAGVVGKQTRQEKDFGTSGGADRAGFVSMRQLAT
jgi:hypothetical protein